MLSKSQNAYQPLLTPEDRVRLKNLNWQAYEQEGVDVSLLVTQLEKSPTERFEINNRMLEFIAHLKAAPRKN